MEAVEKHGKKKVYDIKLHMETSNKFNRSEDEIANRIKNIWRKNGIYSKAYQRAPFVRPKAVHNPINICILEDEHAQAETKREQAHNKIQQILTKLMKRD